MHTASEESLGVAVIGYGWMGRTHTYAYRCLPFCYQRLPFLPRLVGVAVRRRETLADAMSRGGFTVGTVDYRELLRRDDIHIVHICTPTGLHAEQVIAALEAGKHVYCDKPLTATADQTQAVLTCLSRQPGPPANQVAYQYRYYPCTLRAKALIEEGRLGRIWSFRAAYLHASLIDPARPIAWRQQPEHGGGSLADIGSHLLDMLCHLLGPVAEVCAESRIFIAERPDPRTGRPQPVEGDDLTLAMLRMSGGAVGTLEASKLATGVHDELRVEIHGDRGALRFNLGNPNVLEFFDQGDPDEPLGGTRGFRVIETQSRYPAPAGYSLPPRSHLGWINAHIACLHHFLCAVAGQCRPAPDFAAAAHVQEAIEACRRSARGGGWEAVAPCR